MFANSLLISEKQLSVLGVKNTEIITDNGFYSESNLVEMLQKGFGFFETNKKSEDRVCLIGR